MYLVFGKTLFLYVNPLACWQKVDAVTISSGVVIIIIWLVGDKGLHLGNTDENCACQNALAT